MVYLKEDYLRPKSLTPTYPPYHQGEYLEEYFYSHYQQLEDKINVLREENKRK